jgi:hypothetical protein
MQAWKTEYVLANPTGNPLTLTLSPFKVEREKRRTFDNS